MLSECPYMLSNSPRAGRQAVDAYSCCPLNVAKSQVQVRPSPRGRGTWWLRTTSKNGPTHAKTAETCENDVNVPTAAAAAKIARLRCQ